MIRAENSKSAKDRPWVVSYFRMMSYPGDRLPNVSDPSEPIVHDTQNEAGIKVSTRCVCEADL